MNAKAFTLLELVIAVAVIAVLGALSFPVYQRVVQGSRAAECLSRLGQLGAALNLYLGENNAVLPTMAAGRSSVSQPVPSIDTVLLPYAGSAAVFACPADNGNYAVNTGTSYFWNSALNGQSVAALSFFFTSETSKIPLMFDKGSFHPYEANKVNFLYADGHATKDLKLSVGK